MEKYVLHVRLDDNLLKALETYAVDHELTASEVTRNALEMYLREPLDLQLQRKLKALNAVVMNATTDVQTIVGGRT